MMSSMKNYSSRSSNPRYIYNLGKSVALLYFDCCILSPSCIPLFPKKEDNHDPYRASKPVNRLEGGGYIVFPYKDLVDYKINHYDQSSKPMLEKFKCFNIVLSDNPSLDLSSQHQLICNIPLTSSIISGLPNQMLRLVGAYHNLSLGRTKQQILKGLANHHTCSSLCRQTYVVFEPSQGVKWDPVVNTSTQDCATAAVEYPSVLEFPPRPLDKYQLANIVKNFCDATHPSLFEECGCAVCAQLVPIHQMNLLSDSDVDLDLLYREGVTVLERKRYTDPVQSLNGPIIASQCDYICNNCISYMKKYKKPPIMSLANGLWIGDIPKELQGLTFVEKMMIARVCHSYCFIKVAVSWRMKMKANVVCFSNPIPKVYNILPPAREELDAVIAFMYTGPCKPTPDELQRTPLLVRLNKVRNASEWLKLNHQDYKDLDISDAKSSNI